MHFRRLEKDDLQFLNEVRNHYCEEFLHDSRKFTIEETVSWFQEYNPEYYIIEINGNRIGYFRISNVSKTNRNLYLGADIHPKFVGLGYGYKSYVKFIPFLFDHYQLNKITLEVLATNTRAINLYHKLGFHQEGVKRQEVYRNGQYVDSIIMSLLKKEYDRKL